MFTGHLVSEVLTRVKELSPPGEVYIVTLFPGGSWFWASTGAECFGTETSWRKDVGSS